MSRTSEATLRNWFTANIPVHGAQPLDGGQGRPACEPPLMATTTTTSIGGDDAALKSPQKHRTAKLVRDLPRNLDPRLQTIEFPSYNIPNPYGPGTYAFGYEIEDPATGNVQFRDEEKLQNGTVRGSYGYLQPDGNVIRTRFIADLYGYRANTEIRQANGQVIASIPTHETMETQASNQDNVVAEPANQYPTYSMPPTYSPALNPSYIDPSYTQAILNHIKDQQYLQTQGYVQNPYGMPQLPMMRPPIPQAPMFYDTSSNGNVFSNFFSQFPSNLAPSNIYNNLQTTFPNFIPQQNPLNNFATNLQNGYQQFAQNNPFNSFVTNAQSSFQQLIPQNNPFAGWFNPNNNNPQPQLYLQQSPQLFNRPGSMVYGDTGTVPAGVYSDMPMGMNGNRVPTTKRRGVTTTRRKNGYKTRDGSDWLDDFLENRKREVVYGMTTVAPAVTDSTVKV
ncbi:conserved hypothetical protein [Culex quinquefasciatus]|uniref:Cuticle protein n=1 Tax=Culex quinquefasciatus TaxID=7176 RepID=B0XHM0_CULQU|nr:conserved hypothetical protein [Culex quinquefasciatus]|eukprot:XP_001869142.1 conserved hypothetical protein [Culex quinquefasciatus]